MRPLDASRGLMRDRATVLAALDAELSRRRLLQAGLGGALILTFGSILPSGCERYSPIARELKFLTRKEYAVATQAAVRILGLEEDARDDIGVFIDGLLADLPTTSQRQARLMLRVVEHGTHLFDLKTKRFTRLSPPEQDAYLRGWMESSLGARRVIFRALKTMAALGFYAQPGSWDSIGYDGPVLGRAYPASDFQAEEPVSITDVERKARAR